MPAVIRNEEHVFQRETDVWKLHTDDVDPLLDYPDFNENWVTGEIVPIQPPSSVQKLNRLYRALQLLKDAVEIVPERRGGYPVLTGTRFKASQLLAQIAEGDSIADLEENLGLDRDVMEKFLLALSICLDRQWTTPREAP